MDKVSKAIDFLVEEDPLFTNPITFNDEWLDSYTKYWTRRLDGKIDVEGTVRLADLGLDKIPYDFGKVTGSFWCGNNQLTSLEGSPEHVKGNFACYDNQLTSLTGAPKKVEGGFNCGKNQLTSLKGAPVYIGSSLYCYDNAYLDSLEGAPQHIGGNFYSEKFTDDEYRAYVKERDG